MFKTLVKRSHRQSVCLTLFFNLNNRLVLFYTNGIVFLGYSTVCCFNISDIRTVLFFLYFSSYPYAAYIWCSALLTQRGPCWI